MLVVRKLYTILMPLSNVRSVRTHSCYIIQNRFEDSNQTLSVMYIACTYIQAIYYSLVSPSRSQIKSHLL